MERLSTPLFGTDSTSQVPLGAAHSAGMKFTYRYLSHFTPKVLTQNEFNSDRANGIAVCVVFEDEADAALKGYDYGKSHALFGRAQLEGTTGIHGPIVFAVDIDPNEHPDDAFDPYFDGCAAALGHENCGPYGGFKVVKRMFDRGFKRGYQTYAWSANQFDRRAQVIQYSNDHFIGGVNLDFDHAYYDDFNQLGYFAKPIDPNHYDRYDTTTRRDLVPQGLGIHNEKECALLYDKYRAMQRKFIHPHRKELAILRKQSAWFFGRLRKEANTPNNGGWNAFHRGWRGKQFYHRYLGQKVTV